MQPFRKRWPPLALRGWSGQWAQRVGWASEDCYPEAFGSVLYSHQLPVKKLSANDYDVSLVWWGPLGRGLQQGHWGPSRPWTLQQPEASEQTPRSFGFQASQDEITRWDLHPRQMDLPHRRARQAGANHHTDVFHVWGRVNVTWIRSGHIVY